MNISEAFSIALAQHQAGRLDVAADIYRRILALEPEHADSLHLSGLIAYQTGRPDAAVDPIRRAIALRPSVPYYHGNLGEAYRALGRAAEAATCYQRAIELAPSYPEALNGLGLVWKEQGKLDASVACYRRALELRPGYAEAHSNLAAALDEQEKRDEAVACFRRAIELMPELAQAHLNLGIALQKLGKREEAAACFRRALQCQPDWAEAHTCLGVALWEQGKSAEAAACHRRAIELKPELAEAHVNLGIALKTLGRREEAAACCRRALQCRPDWAEASTNLGTVLKEVGQLDEAVACHQRAIQLRPDSAQTHNNLGVALKERGQLDEAVACYRRAIQLRPDDAESHSNLLYTLLYCANYDARMIYQEHCRWNQQHAALLGRSIQPHCNDRSPERRLRIGYVSPDFRTHSVGRLLLPLVEAHDHREFEIFGYSSVQVPDAITDRCRAAADVWREVLGLADEELAGAVREDQIDVLVDLSMHTAYNRMLVFARKPAPVQVTYLAYCGTTGLDTMDYRLTDPYLDPPGGDEQFYSEQSVHLPETYWCYRPTADCPPVGPLPALGAGCVTFGCLNNFCKVTEPTLAAWCALLRAVPMSRLIVHAQAGSHQQRVRAFLAGHGVAAERLTFVGLLPMLEYLQVYQRIDVALDPFPYGGGTTTCDGLWMGVPAVSLAGQTGVGRGGVSILSNIGLPELIARDVDQYARIAAQLAGDLPRLAELRGALRQRMQESPLMDAPRFARHVEAAFRGMWQRWCASVKPRPVVASGCGRGPRRLGHQSG